MKPKPADGSRTRVARRLAICLVASITIATALAQFLPQPPPDPRKAEARRMFDNARYHDAAELLDGYVAKYPGDADAAVLLGWTYYRLGQFKRASEIFEATARRSPINDDARIGFAYCAIQLQQNDQAVSIFDEILRRNPDHSDALRGIILAARRNREDARLAEASRQAVQRLKAIEPATAERAGVELSLEEGSERRLRFPAPQSQPITNRARAGRDYLETLLPDGSWQPIFIKGFNVGVALPGHFAAEFPTDEKLYRSWLRMIAQLNANTVRVYTLLPPAFYRAVVAHNADVKNRKLWLIQGVWTELPPDHDFDHARYLDDFHAEIRRVIDAVHGNLALGPRPGHAWGIYDVDASESLLAYIIGREWEPFAVADYNKRYPNRTSWTGRWFRVSDARAMECWVARSCEIAAEYEAAQYRVLHPLTFANWPTLDPLPHPTEATRAEEDRWKKQYGIPHPLVLKEAPWEDDAVTLDATRIEPSSEMTAGFFAAYHIYPNSPDFLNLDPGYSSGRDAEGPSRYAAYLAALKQYHGSQAVLVAEFGMSTSRGIAHLQPLGWHHGGMDERDQGRIVARMLRSIRDEKYAGGIVFEFLDEWFKGTWSVAPFEIPEDRRRLWFNAESPEESYGILAARPARTPIRIDGYSSDWVDVTPLLAD